MWRRVAADPNRVVSEPVQKEKEGNFIDWLIDFDFFFLFLFFFLFFLFLWTKASHDSSRPDRRSIREKDARKIQQQAWERDTYDCEGWPYVGFRLSGMLGVTILSTFYLKEVCKILAIMSASCGTLL